MEYSTSGHLLCPTCHGNSLIADSDARAAAARRAARITAIVVGVLVVGVPSVMYMLGLGRLVAHAVVAMGALSLVGGSITFRMFVMRSRHADPMVATATAVMMAGGFGVVFFGLWLEKILR